MTIHINVLLPDSEHNISIANGDIRIYMPAYNRKYTEHEKNKILLKLSFSREVDFGLLDRVEGSYLARRYTPHNANDILQTNNINYCLLSIV